MGILLDRIDDSLKKYGNGIVDNFKNNSLYYFNKYQKSDERVKSIPLYDIQMGRFHFFHYYDDSNWIKYSPVFTISQKKIGNLTIIFAINLNLIPIQIRATIFDPFITEKDMEENRALKVDFNGVYQQLKKYGFEYSIMEYNLSQMNFVHRINMSKTPTFLYSGHPINKYDPRKLLDIWKVKLKTKEQRDQEMSQALIEDFYNISDDINDNYNVLRKHIQRLQNSYLKYGM